MFHLKLLRAQISKAQKDTENMTDFLCFMEPAAVHKHVGEINPRWACLSLALFFTAKSRQVSGCDCFS